jgi:hypothetical protein
MNRKDGIDLLFLINSSKNKWVYTVKFNNSPSMPHEVMDREYTVALLEKYPRCMFLYIENTTHITVLEL